MSVQALVVAMVLPALAPASADLAATSKSATCLPADSHEFPAPATLVAMTVPAAAPSVSTAPVVEEDIVVSAPRRDAVDPLESVNVQAFEVTQSVDKAFVGPAALTYKRTLPEPIRDGLRNFFNNLKEPDVFLNFVLQAHIGKAIETIGRFAINSTIGGAGLFDVAKHRPFNLPRRPNGFANTMGYYGVKPGAFLFVPLIGPTTVRDALGGGLDRLLLPFAVGAPFNQLAYNLPAGAVGALDRRVGLDDELQALREGDQDLYTARRNLYLRKRQAEIDALHGRRRETGYAPSGGVSAQAAIPSAESMAEQPNACRSGVAG
jgi:phospholipid-binding lipoprotein MlaA